MSDRVDDSTDISYYTDLANRYDVLTIPEERDLLNRVQDYPSTVDSQKAMSKLIYHNQRIVISIAKRYQKKGLTFQDLLQEGNMGLLKGIIKFDITRRHEGKLLKLSTYATCWIRQAITRAIANLGKMIRVPINVCADYTLVQRLYGRFAGAEENVGRRPNEDELSILYNQAVLQEKELWLALPKAKRDKKKLKLKPKTAKEILELGGMFLDVESLDVANSEDENLTLLDYLCEEEDRQPENITEVIQDKELLCTLLKELDEEEMSFISLRFGLLDKERDRKSVSALKKMTPEDTAKKEAAILKKMADKATSMGLTPMAVIGDNNES